MTLCNGSVEKDPIIGLKDCMQHAFSTKDVALKHVLPPRASNWANTNNVCYVLS